MMGCSMPNSSVILVFIFSKGETPIRADVIYALSFIVLAAIPVFVNFHILITKFLKKEKIKLNKNCKSIGRIFYEIDGNIEIEAEIYFSDQCQHFVFMKDNKRIYANNLTPEGVAHFKNIFKQAAGMNK